MEGSVSAGTIVRRILLVVVLGVAFASSAMLTIYVLFQSGEVKVPNTVGMSEQDAEKTIERAGLQFKLRRQHFDPEAPVGAVTDQDPAPGFPVKYGFDVKIDVSKGPDPTGASEEPPPPGPTNPVDGPKNENANANANKKKKDENKNANANANANSNTNANGNKAAPADDEAGPSVKPKPGETPKPGTTPPLKPGTTPVKPGDATKPPPPKPQPKPTVVKVPPHDD